MILKFKTKSEGQLADSLIINYNPNDTFFEFVSRLFYDCSKTKPENVDFFISRKVPYPQILRDSKTLVIVPMPKIIKDGGCVFEGYLFEDSEADRRNLWALFLASIYNLAAHCTVSQYHIYDQWQKDKTREVCWRVIDFIEDVAAEKYLSFINPNAAEKIQKIKDVLHSLNTQEETLPRKSSVLKNYFIRYYGDGEHKQKIEEIRKQISIKSGQGLNRQKEEMLTLANVLYQKKDFLPKFTMPFCEHHDEHMVRKYHLKKNKMNFTLDGNFVNMISILDELWLTEETRRQRILSSCQKHLKGLEFDEVVIPTGNIHNYLKMKTKNKLLIKNIRNQIRLVNNIIDDPSIQRLGYVNLQYAIQAIASESKTTDIFDRDEDRRSEEAWVILIDNSASMHLKLNKMTEFALCVAESADELTGRADAWGFYAFDSRFLILKDFQERFNQDVKARLGDLKSGGLSFIPDAIKLAGRLLIDSPQERKYIFVITDGHTSGYENMEKALSAAVKELEMSGITILWIGPSKYISTHFRNSVSDYDMKKLISRFISAYRSVAT